MIKKILIFLALACCLSVPAFAADAVVSPDGLWTSTDFWDGISHTYYITDFSNQFPDFVYNRTIWRDPSGQLKAYADYNSGRATYIHTDDSGNLVFRKSSSGSFFTYDGSKWSKMTGTPVFASAEGKSQLLAIQSKVLYSYNGFGHPFFQSTGSITVPPTPTPTPVPTPAPPRPLEEVVEEMQGTQVKASLIPYLEDSLGSLVPFGIGLLASLAALAILPKVLRKFLA